MTQAELDELLDDLLVYAEPALDDNWRHLIDGHRNNWGDDGLAVGTVLDALRVAGMRLPDTLLGRVQRVVLDHGVSDPGGKFVESMLERLGVVREMTREDRIEWYVALGMTRADAEVQVAAEKGAPDPVFPDDELEVP